MEEVTIKEVAKKAGVSVGTVSRFINGAQNLKEINRINIEAAINQFGFRPNQHAKGLKSNKSNIIGIILPSLKGVFYQNIVDEVEQLAKNEGYLVVVLCSKGSPEHETECINFLWEKRVDGIVITSEGGNEDLLLKISEAGTPVLFTDRRPQKHLFDSVYSDQKYSAYQAASYLIENGHNKIALALGRKDLVTNIDRFNGFIQSMFDHNIPVRNDYIHFGPYSLDYGVEFMRWFSGLASEARPTAVISNVSLTTYGLLIGAKKYGISIPDEISIVSCAHLDLEDLMVPKITYMHHADEEICKTIAVRIMEKIKNPSSQPKQIVFNSELIVFDSVKKMI